MHLYLLYKKRISFQIKKNRNTVPHSYWCGRCTRLLFIAVLIKPCTCTCATKKGSSFQREKQKHDPLILLVRTRSRLLSIVVLFKPCTCICARKKGSPVALHMHCTYTCTKENGYLYVETNKNTVPFSYWCRRYTRLLHMLCTCTYINRRSFQINKQKHGPVLLLVRTLYSSLIHSCTLQELHLYLH
jgi:hypothetical protein